MVQIGDAVIFVDSKGRECDAVLTAVHGCTPEQLEKTRLDFGEESEIYKNHFRYSVTPSVNLVFVSLDENERDTYGRQIKRETSIVHKVNQMAHGMYWKEK